MTDAMVKIEEFAVVFSNDKDLFYAGETVSGDVVLLLPEKMQLNEILLELKGYARTAWSKHKGRSRQLFAMNEPYFCEQFNTNYTHSYERVLPAGKHVVPFSFELPVNLPTSFEGSLGHVRYVCTATIERPWDCDLVCRKVFSVIGIEDLNDNKNAVEQIQLHDTEFTVKLCCAVQGTISVNLFLPKAGYVPGEQLTFNAEVTNNSSRSIAHSIATLKQHICYQAKSFSGHEAVRHETRELVFKRRGPIKAHSKELWKNEFIKIPSIPPKLMRCRAIDVSYTLELEMEPGIVVVAPLLIGTVPLIGSIADIQLQSQLTPEEDLVKSGKSRRLSVKYPMLPRPEFEESVFGSVDIREGNLDSMTHGSYMFTPRYPCYRLSSSSSEPE